MSTKTIADIIQGAENRLIAPDGIELNLLSAISEFSEVLRGKASTPNQRATAYNGIGYAYYQLGELDAALKALEESIKCNPKYASSYVNKAAVYNEMGKFNEALQELETAQKLRPAMPNFYSVAGDAYRCLGLEEEARLNYVKALRVITNKARLYRTVTDYFGAIRAQKGLELMGIRLADIGRRHDYIEEALSNGIPRVHIDRVKPVQIKLVGAGR